MVETGFLRPGDPEFGTHCSGWNARVVHRPDLILAATTPEQVQEAVRFAARRALPIHVQSTGHGALAPCEGGLLIDMSRLDKVAIDPSRRCAVVSGGARWRGVLDAAGVHGLTGLAGSSPDVGVVGYTLGGGAGWLSRRYGLCSDTMTAAEVITIDGDRRWVDEKTEPDLFWALRGGGGNFGVVAAIRLRLLPVSAVHAGALFWPISHACDVLSVYRQWIETIPADVGSAVAFIQYPALAPVPEPVRGVPVIALRLCHPGPPDAAERLLAPVRAISGLMLDTVRSIPYREIGSVSMDSPLHLPRIGYSEALSGVSELLAWELPKVLTPGAPFLAMELRYVGNGAARPPPSYEGLGYWHSQFLFFGMSVTRDAASESAAVNMATQLDAIFAPCRSATNALTFLLAQHAPSRDGDAARVRRAYTPAHYARLAALKARYDPSNLLGHDRNIPPPSGAPVS